MPTYRLYKLDEAGRSDTSESIEADDDYDAMRLARAKEHPFMCELWLSHRLVGRFRPFML